MTEQEIIAKLSRVIAYLNERLYEQGVPIPDLWDARREVFLAQCRVANL